MGLEGPILKSSLSWKQTPYLVSMSPPRRQRTPYFQCPSSYPHLGLGSPFHVMSLGPRDCLQEQGAVLQIEQSQPESMSRLSRTRSPLPSLPSPTKKRQARTARLGTRSPYLASPYSLGDLAQGNLITSVSLSCHNCKMGMEISPSLSAQMKPEGRICKNPCGHISGVGNQCPRGARASSTRARYRLLGSGKLHQLPLPGDGMARCGHQPGEGSPSSPSPSVLSGSERQGG